MKNLEEKLIPLLNGGYCVPHLSRIARKLGESASTIHYNIKRMEKEGKIIAYKAVFDHVKIGQGFCVLALVSLSHEEYSDPERIAKEISKYPQVQSLALIAGDWEMAVRIRVKDNAEYYSFIKHVLSKKGIANVKSLTILKEVKNEYVGFD